MIRSAVILLLIVAMGGALRLIGLGWGIPRYDAALANGTRLRASYHPDEDRILWQLERMRPEALDFNPGDFGWGTLQTYLVGATLAGAQAAGAFEMSWRESFRAGHANDFPPVFVIGRLISALFGLATLFVAYGLARESGGLWAAALLAVSPLHVLSSHFLTTDVALTFWVSLALLLLLRSRHLAAGLAAGAALATKSSALVLVPLLVLAHFVRREAGWWRAYPALVGAFLLGQPYALLDFRAWWEAMGDLLRNNTVSVGLAPLGLLARQSFHLVYYGLGPVVSGLALVGFWRHRPERGARLLAGASLLWFASLGLSRYPLARYTLPLVPVFCVAAGSALARLSRSSALFWGAAAVLPPLALSVGQVGLLTRPHTAQRAADWIEKELPPGSRISQLWHEYPILDGNRFRLSLFEDPFGLQDRPAQPLESDLVVVDDFPLISFRPEFLSDLEQNYRLGAVLHESPRLGPFLIPEPAAPHDWKYTHPEIRLYLRR